MYPCGIRDATGALWVPSEDRRSFGTGDRVEGQLTIRMAAEGPVEQLRDAGWPCLKDKNGNIWLGAIHGRRPEVFGVWRDGKILHALTVPAAFDGSDMFSNKPGSVFVWTSMGLQHLVAPDPAKPAHYSLAKLYFPRDFVGKKTVMKPTTLGMVAISSQAEQDNGTKVYLYLIDISGIQ